MENIYDKTYEELEEHFINKGEAKFRATQIFEWLYKKRIKSFDEINNIKKDVITEIKDKFTIGELKIITKQIDTDVVKYLFELDDKTKIEAVLLKQSYGNSLCISTQVGCNMGCQFCESGRLKRVRNLKTSEMVMQILKIEEDLNLRISHVVLMGIGEPFDNYENVIKFLRIVNHPKGIDIGARHITVSTCGVVPKIEEFIKDGGQVNLAISLHAPNNNLRNKLMPINKVYNLEKLIEVVKKYVKETNRRITFEYILLRGINDSKECALELARLIRGINAYVNLIPYNETSVGYLKKTHKEKVLEFYDILKKEKINVTIRKELGSNVTAACGQLSSKYEEEN